MQHYFNPISRGATTAWMFAELDVEHEDIVVDLRGYLPHRVDGLVGHPVLLGPTQSTDCRAGKRSRANGSGRMVCLCGSHPYNYENGC